MKPVIFPPYARPILSLEKRAHQEVSECSVVEIGSDYMVVTSRGPLALKGKLLFEGQGYEFSKRGEHQLDDLYYSELSLKPENATHLQRSFLARLPAQELSEWILSNMGNGPIEEPQSHFSAQEENQLDQGVVTKVFEFIVCQLYERPWLSVVLLILLSIFPLRQLPHLTMDPSLDRILVKDSPEMLYYKKSLSIFGSDKSAILYVQDPNIFTKEKLETLRTLAWDFQKWPEVERVNSVFTSSFIRSQDETLYTEPLFQDIPTSDTMPGMLSLVQQDPILHGRLIDVPKNAIVFILKLGPENKGLHNIARKVQKKITPLKSQFEKLFQTGEPTIELFQTQEMEFSPKIFLPLIALILFLSFTFIIRSFHAFVITIFASTLSLLWSFGLMTWMGIPVQIMIILIPTITLSLSATEIVHLATSLRSAWQKGLFGVEALRYMSRDVGRAIFLTFTSTALGFLSIRVSEILVLQEFAIVSFMTLILVFIITLLYLPLHFRLFGPKALKTNESQRQNFNGEGQFHDLKIFSFLQKKFHLYYLNSFFSRKSAFVFGVFILLNLVLASRVKMDNDAFEMIAKRTTVKKNLDFFKKNMGGMKEIHLVLENDRESLLKSDHLKSIWRLHQRLESLPQVVDVQSIAGLMALLNKEMRSGFDKDYKIPSSQNLISQYMLTLSRDDVDPYLSPDKMTANIRLAHDISSSAASDRFIEEVEDILKEMIEESSLKGIVTTKLTSRNILNVHAAKTITKSQVLSLVTMSVVIVILMALFFRSFKIGLVSLIPNLVPIIGLFGLMGLSDIPLNIGTCIVAAITIGIAADDTIHLFSRYFKDRALMSDPFLTGKESIYEELIPILSTSLTLSLGFLTFIFAKFIPLLQFGVLSAYVLVLAVISDLYIGPWVLTTFDLKNMKGTRHFFTYLLNHRCWHGKGELAQLPLNEKMQILRAGVFKAYYKGQREFNIQKEEELLCFIIKGRGKVHGPGELLKETDIFSQEEVITLTIEKNKLRHLSPRIFEKLCHN
jgi:predicted RND superfamily exporter protein